MKKAVYRKPLENGRERIDFWLVSNIQELKKFVSTHYLKRLKRFTNNLAEYLVRHKSIIFNRPVSLDFTVLVVN